jgi:hypothetical protein
VGDLVAGTLAAAKEASGPRAQVTRVLQEAMGETLLGQLEVTGIRAGVVSLTVQEPAAACQLRLHWEQVILQSLRRELPALGIREVRFVTRAGRW